MSHKKILTSFLLIFSLGTFLYAWIYYPLTQNHEGDFSHRLRGEWSYDRTWVHWDGKGMDVYGPIFTLMDYGIHEFHLERLMVLRGLFLFYLILNLASSLILLRIFNFWHASKLKLSAGIFLITNFFPLIQMLRQDVVENLQFFSVVLLIFFLVTKKNYSFISGSFLGIGVAAKTFPIVLAPYLWRRGFYKVVIFGMGLFFLIVAIVSSIKEVSFFEGIKGIFFFHGSVYSSALSFHQNQAISGFVYRLFAHVDYNSLSSLTHPRLSAIPFQQFQVIRYLLTILTICYVLYKVFPLFRNTYRFEAKELIYFEISILFVLLVCILPHAQIHYFILCLPAYLFLFDYLFRGPSQWYKKGFLILSYVLVGFRLPLRLLDLIYPSKFACPYLQLTNIWNFPFYGLIILLFLLIKEYRQRCGYEIQSRSEERNNSHEFVVAP